MSIYAYVYAPIGGRITGRVNYCRCNPSNYDPSCTGSGSSHLPCKGWVDPVDIAGTGTIYLVVNYPTVRKVHTRIEYQCCCRNSSDYARAITVDLFIYTNGQHCYVGSVMYGHIGNPMVPNDHDIYLNSSWLPLGQFLSGTYSCNGLMCYTGAHVHMERFGGETLAPCCCASVSQGTTPIYRFLYTRCPA